MSDTENVIWSEGMFLRPQHFQQYTRYLENFVEARSSVLGIHPWGFSEIKVDESLLPLGKIGISKASGVFPDGTPFNFPADNPLPLAVDIPDNVKDQKVYLCIPLRRKGTVNVNYNGEINSLARYAPDEVELFDDSTLGGNEAAIQVGKLRSRLLLDGQHRDEYACLGFTKVTEVNSDKSLKLNESYIPPVLNCRTSTRIKGFIDELLGLLKHRLDALAGRVAASGRGGASDIADFLMLQLINRCFPLIKHVSESMKVHPESFYQLAISIAGEMSTFTTTKKQTPEFIPYQHEDLAKSFDSVFSSLRQSLSMVIEQTAVSLPLQERSFGIRVAAINDKSLLDKSTLVVAVSASMPTEEVIRRFPAVVKVGPVELIRNLVNHQLEGIRIRPLPVAPRQIPFHAGYVYFELERGGEIWGDLRSSGGFAFHIGGEFPGMKLQLWAIRG